jgi:hypothetical protein
MAVVSVRHGAVLVLATLALAAGCSSSATAPKAFCDAAQKYETELDREVTAGKRDIPKQISLVKVIAATAPASIHADAQTYLNAMLRVQHDPGVRDNPAIRRAVDDVNRYASAKCGFFNQQPSGV